MQVGGEDVPKKGEKSRSYLGYFLIFNEVISNVIDAITPRSVRVWRMLIHFFVVFFVFYLLLDWGSSYISFPIAYDRLFMLVAAVAFLLSCHGWWTTYRRKAQQVK
jgi:hypothetical protein